MLHSFAAFSSHLFVGEKINNQPGVVLHTRNQRFTPLGTPVGSWDRLCKCNSKQAVLRAPASSAGLFLRFLIIPERVKVSSPSSEHIIPKTETIQVSCNYLKSEIPAIHLLGKTNLFTPIHWAQLSKLGEGLRAMSGPLDLLQKAPSSCLVKKYKIMPCEGSKSTSASSLTHLYLTQDVAAETTEL